MKMTLTPLDSPLWESYRGAYGNVCPEIRLLAGAEPMTPQAKIRRLDFEDKDDEQIAFENLCSNLNHQMTFYEANYLALPYVVKLLSHKIAGDDFNWQVTIFSEIGCCLAADIPDEQRSAFESEMPPEILESYRAAELRLQDYAQKFILNNLDRLRQLDENRREFLLTGLLAIMGEHLAAFTLLMSQWNEEICFVCPECDFESEDYSIMEPEMQSQLEPAAIQPWNGASFNQPQSWLPGLLEKLGDKPSAQLIAGLYGDYTCHECGHKTPLLDCIRRFFFE